MVMMTMMVVMIVEGQSQTCVSKHSWSTAPAAAMLLYRQRPPALHNALAAATVVASVRNHLFMIFAKIYRGCSLLWACYELTVFWSSEKAENLGPIEMLACIVFFNAQLYAAVALLAVLVSLAIDRGHLDFLHVRLGPGEWHGKLVRLRQ